MNVRDPRDIVTPDAFSVAPELLGTPLASPVRRGGAMAVDGLLVVLLANAPSVLLAFAAALVVFRASAAGTRAGFLRRWTRRAVRLASALTLFVVTLSMWGRTERAWQGRGDPPPAASRAERAAVAGLAMRAETPAPEAGPAAEADDTIAALQARIEQERERRREAERARDAAESREPGILAWLGRLADDVGLGLGWSGLYFTAFLALWRGQTPGKRVFGTRVVRLDGREMTWWCAFERFGGYAASLATGLLGFFQIFWDANRQGIHDKVVHTVVVKL